MVEQCDSLTQAQSAAAHHIVDESNQLSDNQEPDTVETWAGRVQQVVSFEFSFYVFMPIWCFYIIGAFPDWMAE